MSFPNLNLNSINVSVLMCVGRVEILKYESKDKRLLYYTGSGSLKFKLLGCICKLEGGKLVLFELLL